VLSDLLLGAASNVVGNVLPVSAAKVLHAFNEQQLLVGTPVLLKDRVRMLLNDLVVVPWSVVARVLALCKALHTQIVVRTNGTGNANKIRTVAGAYVTVKSANWLETALSIRGENNADHEWAIRGLKLTLHQVQGFF